jgi:hypothetical protein
MNVHMRAFRRGYRSLDHVKHTEADERPRDPAGFYRGFLIGLPISLAAEC